MKINKLPPEYKRLVEINISIQIQHDTAVEDVINRTNGNIEQCFPFADTPQGYVFWYRCVRAKTEKELPEIPIYQKRKIYG